MSRLRRVLCSAFFGCVATTGVAAFCACRSGQQLHVDFTAEDVPWDSAVTEWWHEHTPFDSSAGPSGRQSSGATDVIARVSFVRPPAAAAMGDSIESSNRAVRYAARGLSVLDATLANGTEAIVVEAGWPWRSFTGERWRTFTGERWADQVHVFVWAVQQPNRWVATSDELDFLICGRLFPLRPQPLGFAADALLFGAGAYAAITALVGIRTAVRRSRGRCIACGYVLGTREGCPECGLGKAPVPLTRP